jgi:hypothetical protein
MSNYTYVSDFGAKDGLDSGDSNKVIKGADFETEFTAIQTAVNSKPDYVTNTFVPTIFDSVTGGNQATVSTTYGRYQKIGDIVYLTIGFSGIDTSGMSPNNPVRIRGLPFTSYNSGTPDLIWAGSVITADVANPTGGGSFSAAITDNTDYLTIRANVTSNPQPENLLVSDIDSGSSSVIYITMFYEAA